MPLETLNFWLSLGTLAMQGAVLALIAVLLLDKKIPELGKISALLGSWALWLGFIFALTASAFTLYYSEVLGIEPCSLCWWQRIFLYPQVIMFGIALYKRDLSVITYSIALSLLGVAFAIYNHALQVLPSGTLPCPAQGVSCAQRFVFEFGYITFPMMSLSLFAFLVVLMLFARKVAAK